MRFKRPQVRYADTPQPATPYQSAAQVWDERIGSARVQAKNWRFMAFGCLTLAVLMAGGLVWRGKRRGAILSLLLLPAGAVYWWGFALPFGPIFALTRTLLIMQRWASLR